MILVKFGKNYVNAELVTTITEDRDGSSCIACGEDLLKVKETPAQVALKLEKAVSEARCEARHAGQLCFTEGQRIS